MPAMRVAPSRLSPSGAAATAIRYCAARRSRSTFDNRPTSPDGGSSQTISAGMAHLQMPRTEQITTTVVGLKPKCLVLPRPIIAHLSQGFARQQFFNSYRRRIPLRITL